MIGINFQTYLYDKKEFKDIKPPWISTKFQKSGIIEKLKELGISYSRIQCKI